MEPKVEPTMDKTTFEPHELLQIHSNLVISSQNPYYEQAVCLRDLRMMVERGEDKKTILTLVAFMESMTRYEIRSMEAKRQKI